MKDGDYEYIIVESFESPPQSGRHGVVHVRAIPGQGAHDLVVESPKAMRYDYPVGTKFKIMARLKYRGRTSFLYTSWQWAYRVVSETEAARFIQERFTSPLTNRPTRTRSGERRIKA